LSCPRGSFSDCLTTTFRFLVSDGFLIIRLDPEYDGMGAGMMMAFGGPMGFAYCLFWAGLRRVIVLLGRRVFRRKRSARPERMHVVAGLTIWASLWVFCIVLPFVAPPAHRRPDAMFLEDYFGVCSPILLVATTMSLMYLVQVLKTESVVRESSECDLRQGKPMPSVDRFDDDGRPAQRA